MIKCSHNIGLGFSPQGGVEMLYYMTGDLLKSDAEALVNTVNCEGYMGKGIAYQFKLQFPKNNEDYIKACQCGYLKPGRLHHFIESGKIIINFPTKDKWREKSKLEYIESGLSALVELIIELDIKSIAIPPLGSGNGGLIWCDVKKIIEEKLEGISQIVDINIYEPSQNYLSIPQAEPKLSTSALVLMEIKSHLIKFSSFRLQKAAYFSNVFSSKNYFNFVAHKYGPYDHSIDVVSQRIREFQKYYGTDSTEEAKKILYNKLISDSVDNKLSEMLPAIQRGCHFVNSIDDDHELECVSTTCFLIEHAHGLTEEEVIHGFKTWSDEKAKKFTEKEICESIKKLILSDIVEETLIGFNLVA